LGTKSNSKYANIFIAAFLLLVLGVYFADKYRFVMLDSYYHVFLAWNEKKIDLPDSLSVLAKNDKLLLLIGKSSSGEASLQTLSASFSIFDEAKWLSECMPNKGCTSLSHDPKDPIIARSWIDGSQKRIMIENVKKFV